MEKFCIEDKDGRIIARDLNMDNVMIFVRALFDTCFNENSISYTITRQKSLTNSASSSDKVVKAVEIIKSMLLHMPKENIEGIYEIVQQAEDFLREVSKNEELGV